MKVVHRLPELFYHAARRAPADLSSKAQERLRWLRIWQDLRDEGYSSARASELLGRSRASLYRWQRRLSDHKLSALEDRSRRPKRRRGPTWTPELAEAVLRLREQYPCWGKDKLVVLLRRQGYQVSASMVWRIIKRLMARGVLREPPRGRIAARRRPRSRPYAVRKPKGYQVRLPGDLVQLDTLDVRLLPGVAIKHYTARDVVSRWDVIGAYTRATANTATAFLDTLLARMPFRVKALQVDGGPEFEAAFERASQERGIGLFVLPPRSPKLNGCVERAHRTHIEEFYEVYYGELDMTSLRRALEEWETVYNHVRPHQALDNRTPAEYLTACHPELAPTSPLSHMW